MIEIKKVDDLYLARITDAKGSEVWKSSEPMTYEDTVRKLKELKYHPLDIIDAFYDVDHDDPNFWDRKL